jgi:CSLREA domain-containing protein
MKIPSLFAVSVIWVVLLFAVECRATTRTVTSLGDSGVGTLRDAVQASDNGDTINFSVTGTISLTSGQLLLTKNMTITGPGANLLEVTRGSANDARIFELDSGNVSISGLALTNGFAGGGLFNSDGGAIILFGGNLTISNCLISGNTAQFQGGAIAVINGNLTVSNCTFSGNATSDIVGSGGAIFYESSGALTITNSTFSGNTSTNEGGAIDNSGTLTVSDSSFTSNFAGSQIFSTDPDRTPAYGGAIYNENVATVTGCTFSNNTVAGFQEARGGAICSNSFGNDTGLTIRNCTIVANSAQSQTFAVGGGISVLASNNSTSTLTVSNSTLSGNSSSTLGGGVYNYDGTLTLTNCTLSGNSASTGGGIYNQGDGNGFTGTTTVSSCTLSNNSASNGGGIYNTGTNSGNAFVTLKNTILFSTNGTPGANLVNVGSGTSISSQGYNLSSDNGGGFLTAAGDQINTDPKLGPLQDNGGPTQTMALLHGSPAWDQGKNFGVTTDGRGLPRPFDVPTLANASGGDGSDIGAVEMQVSPSFVVTTTDDHDDGVCDGSDCTLREAINAANAAAGADVITFKSGVQGTTTLQSGLGPLTVTDSVTITGPGARFLAVSGNNAIRVFTFGSGTSSVSGLNIINGRIVGASDSDVSGGGVSNTFGTTLSFSDCEFSGNFVQGGDSSVVNGSGSDGFGGAIDNGGTLTLDRCTFSNNSAKGGVGGPGSNAVNGNIVGGLGGEGDGGAIFNEIGGNLTINNSTFSGNSATGGKGGNGQFGGKGGDGTAGVFDEGTTTIIGSTFSGNSGLGGGGGSGNSQFSNGASGAGVGGLVTAGNTTVKSTIIAGNSGTGSINSSKDVDGGVTSGGYNLIGSADHSSGFGATGDQTGTDVAQINAVLGSLQNNGGLTDTMALLTNSPAINASNVNVAPARDQRNYVRSGTPDKGAFEFGGVIPVTLANISTRAFVQTGANVMIGGFIITGTGAKKVIIRAIGPSLSNFGITDALQNPTLDLHDGTGALIATNDNWGDAANKQAIIDSQLAPSNSSESAILTTLNPGAYTAIVRGVSNGTGVALVEGYDLDRTVDSKFGNISARALVQTGANVMIGGFVVAGPDSENVIVRAIGPSLASFGIADAMLDPTLDLYNSNGVTLASNDNWEDTQQAQIQAAGLAPSNAAESAILQTLAPGSYTAIVRGKNNTTGVALVEIYGLN